MLGFAALIPTYGLPFAFGLPELRPGSPAELAANVPVANNAENKNDRVIKIIFVLMILRHSGAGPLLSGINRFAYRNTFVISAKAAIQGT